MTEPAKVAHLTSVHPPFDTRIFLKECYSLARSGRDVSLVACHTHDETVNGVKVAAINRASGRLARMVFTSASVLRRAIETGAKIFHFHDPELIPVGIILKVLGKKVIYDAHEDLPKQIEAKEWLPPIARRPTAFAASLLGKLAGMTFDHIVAATPSIAENFPARKTTIVQNFPLIEEFTEDEPRRFTLRPSHVAYIGGISSARSAQEMVEAIGLVNDRAARLKLAGRLESQQLAGDLKTLPGWERTDYLGVLDRAQVSDLLAQSRVGLVTLKPTPNHLMSNPVKMFEYMAAGVPVVASDFPHWRSIIAETGAGLLVDPAKPSEIANAINWVLSNEDAAAEMGERGRRAVLDRYNWKVEEKKLVGVYDGLE